METISLLSAPDALWTQETSSLSGNYVLFNVTEETKLLFLSKLYEIIIKLGYSCAPYVQFLGINKHDKRHF